MMNWLKKFLRKWLEIPAPVMPKAPKPEVQLLWLDPHENTASQLASMFAEIERHDLVVESLWVSPQVWEALLHVKPILVDEATDPKVKAFIAGYLWGSSVFIQEGLGGVVMAFPMFLPQESK